MAYILSFDHNYDYVGLSLEYFASDLPALFNIVYSEKDERFMQAIDFLNTPPAIAYSSINEEELPNKIKTFLLLGGKENAIADYTRDHHN